MKRVILILVLLGAKTSMLFVFFASAVESQAVIVEYHTDAVINSGIYDGVAAHDLAKLDVFGGSISRLYSLDNSIVNVYDNQRIAMLDVEDSSVMNIYGGTIALYNCNLSGSAALNIYGGSWNIANTLLLDNSVLNIFGYGFSNFPTDSLTGFLEDGSPFEFSDAGFHYGASHIHLFEAPEPATVLLLGLGVLFLVAKRSR